MSETLLRVWNVLLTIGIGNTQVLSGGRNHREWRQQDKKSWRLFFEYCGRGDLWLKLFCVTLIRGGAAWDGDRSEVLSKDGKHVNLVILAWVC